MWSREKSALAFSPCDSRKLTMLFLENQFALIFESNGVAEFLEKIKGCVFRVSWLICVEKNSGFMRKKLSPHKLLLVSQVAIFRK